MLAAKRKALGAFYTPAGLADFLASWAVLSGPGRILEPSIGQGSLISALLKQFDQISQGHIVGCEVDRATFDQAKRFFDARSVTLRRANFLELEVSELGLFDAVVANPPFTRNHALSKRLRARLRSKEEFQIVEGAPGLWVYFLLHSLKFIAPGGRLAFIAPGALGFAQYTAPILEEVKRNFSSVEIVRVAGEVEWEGNAQERPNLLLASGFRVGRASSIVRSTMDYGECVPVPEQMGAAEMPATIRQPTLLGDIAKLEIGIVTGANDLFLLDQSTADSNFIGKRDLLPIVARSRHLTSLFISKRDALSLAQNGERTLMFYPKHDLGKRGSRLRRYLQKIPKERREKTLWFKKRSPWWRVQLGRPCHAVFTYMNHLGPRITLVEEGLTCTNTLHRITFDLASTEQRWTVCISALTSFTQYAAEHIGRVYGGGVLKFELNEARRLPLLIPERPIARSVFNRINTALRAGAYDKARELADEELMPGFFGESWREVRAELVAKLAACRQMRGIKAKR